MTFQTSFAPGRPWNLHRPGRSSICTPAQPRNLVQINSNPGSQGPAVLPGPAGWRARSGNPGFDLVWHRINSNPGSPAHACQLAGPGSTAGPGDPAFHQFGAFSKIVRTSAMKGAFLFACLPSPSRPFLIPPSPSPPPPARDPLRSKAQTVQHFPTRPLLLKSRGGTREAKTIWF
jgi:hypothetical protein